MRWPSGLATASGQMPAGMISSKADREIVKENSDMTDTPAVHAPLTPESEPGGDLCIRTLAMPADTNANGDIFVVWLLSQMHIGGGVFATKTTKSRTLTVAIEAMNFRKPV